MRPDESVQQWAFRDSDLRAPIYILDALQLRNSGQQNIFFDVLGREMRAIARATTPGFAYMPGQVPEGHQFGGKGFLHQLYQVELVRHVRHKQWLRFFNRGPHGLSEKICFRASAINLEWPFDRFDQKFFADAMLTVRPKNQNAKRYGSKLIVELTDTHASSPQKVIALYGQNMAAIDVALPRESHVRNDAELPTRDEAEVLRLAAERFWMREVDATVICRPKTDEEIFDENDEARLEPPSERSWLHRRRAESDPWMPGVVFDYYMSMSDS